MTSTQLAERIAQLAWDKKGSEVLIMDIRKLTDVTDYFVLVSGESELHVKAICDFVEEELEKEGVRPWHKEGYQHLNWVLLDYIDVVFHVFLPHVRDFYALEKLWADADITRLEEDVTDRVATEE